MLTARRVCFTSALIRDGGRSSRSATAVRRLRGDRREGPDGANERKSRRLRRQFDDDFKAQAVRLVLDEGKTVGAVARDHSDLTETALREWVKRARADRTNGRTGLTTAEREELARLRKETRILLEEREFLRKAAASFANERR